MRVLLTSIKSSTIIVDAPLPVVSSALSALHDKVTKELSAYIFAEGGALHPWVRVVSNDSIISVDAPIKDGVVLRLISPIGGG